jgi:hypothetical protein
MQQQCESRLTTEGLVEWLKRVALLNAPHEGAEDGGEPAHTRAATDGDDAASVEVLVLPSSNVPSGQVV